MIPYNLFSLPETLLHNYFMTISTGIYVHNFYLNQQIKPRMNYCNKGK